MPTDRERLEGGLLGLLVGDALGVPYKFQTEPPFAAIEFEPPSRSALRVPSSALEGRKKRIVASPIGPVSWPTEVNRMSQQQPASRGAADPVETVRALCRHIEAHPDEPTTLAALGSRAELSPAHLQRVFKRLTGLTPRQYADACRLGLLKERLKQRETVTVAMYEAGYGSSSRLYERAAGQLGMTPATYQRGGRAVRIAFTVADSPLGRLLLAATERGVCMVSLGDADAPLEAALFAEYPAAAGFDRDEERLRPWLDQLLEHLRGDRPHIDLPLDVQATAFRWRVWQELSKIPAGETRSYAEIARAVGQPAAVRAVGSACGANPVAVVIPCHRAIRTDGGLGGYRWGLDKKRALLQREREEKPKGETEA